MNHLYTGALAPFLPLIKDELHLTLTEVGVITSAAIITMTSSHLVVGHLVDKGWKDVFIPASVLMTAVIVLLSSLATSFAFLATCMLLLGFAAAPYHPSAFPALTEKFSVSYRAKATGIQAAGGLVGMALIPILGVALLINYGTWRNSLRILAGVGFLVFVPITLMMLYANLHNTEVSSEREEGDGEDGWTRNFVVVLIVSGLRGMPFRCTTLLMPLYLVINYGYEPLWAGSLTTLMLVTGLFGQLVSAPASDRLGRRKPFIVLSPAMLAPILLLLNFSLGPIPLIIVLMGVGFFYFFGVPPTQALETEVSPAHARGLAFGILFSIGAIPGSVAPMIFGFIGDNYGLNASITFLVVTAILAAIVALFIDESKINTGAPQGSSIKCKN